MLIYLITTCKDKYNMNTNKLGPPTPNSKGKVELDLLGHKCDITYKGIRYRFGTRGFVSKAGRKLVGLHNPKGKRVGFITYDTSYGSVALKTSKYKFTKEEDTWEFTENVYKKDETFLTNPRYHEDRIRLQIIEQLKELDITCYSNYKFQDLKFHIAIFKDKKLLGIIQIKKLAEKWSTINYSNRKLTKESIQKFPISNEIVKYINTGYPVFVCRGYPNIPLAIEFAKELYKTK